MPVRDRRSLVPFAARVLVRLAVALVAVGVFAAPAADAKADLKKAIWGPAQVDGVSQFPIYRDLGVGIYQMAVDWRETAPTKPADALDPNDPAYKWDPNVDFAVGEAKKYGIKMLIRVWQTPAWANGGSKGNAPPSDPQDYARFTEAVAKRYPGVHLFMVWVEPIRANLYLLHPTSSPNYYTNPKATTRLPSFTTQQRADAQGYAQLVDATYGRLKALSSKNLIIGGNTTTSGDVDPFNWARWMRLKNGKPPRMDMWGHNPFGTRAPNLKKDQITAGTADFSDLDVFVPWLDRWLKRGGRNPKLKLFISEYTAPTDVANYAFPFHVTRAVQAKWLTAGLKIAKSWSRIYSFGWFMLYDSKRADGQETRWGLIDATGVKKPAYYAFKRG